MVFVLLHTRHRPFEKYPFPRQGLQQKQAQARDEFSWLFESGSNEKDLSPFG